MGAANIVRLWSAGLKQSASMDLASGDVLQLNPEVDDQGSMQIGDGSADMDVKVFLGSSTEHVLLDVGSSQVTLTGVPLVLTGSAGSITCDSSLTMSDGATVTQGSGSGKATAVTINANSGQITTDNADLATLIEVVFTVTNSAVSATSVIIVNIASGQTTAGEHALDVGAVASGSFNISISNETSGTLGDALVINFVVINGASS